MDGKNTAIGAIGAVLGYIGAEGATPAIFQRLLWPQRAHSGFTLRHALKIGLLGPSGGPIYKAALQVLDNAFANGLLRGSGRGHMLGTIFFPQSKSTYTLESNDDHYPSHTEPARNCLWERVVALIPVPSLAEQHPVDNEATAGLVKTVRSQVAVHHITLSICELNNTMSSILDIATDSRRLSTRMITAILTSEVTGVFFALLVALEWKSWLAVLWVLPLLIKLLSAAAALERENLSLEECQRGGCSPAPAQNFEIHMPPESGSFLVLTGPPHLCLQFFRHFGHPKRHRAREIWQLTLVVASACIFPLGLIFSVTIMSEPVQYAWLSYQMYLVLAMYASRYMSLELWTSTEKVIADSLAQNEDPKYLWRDETCGKTVKVILHTSLHERYGEARESARQLQQDLRASQMLVKLQNTAKKECN